MIEEGFGGVGGFLFREFCGGSDFGYDLVLLFEPLGDFMHIRVSIKI